MQATDDVAAGVQATLDHYLHGYLARDIEELVGAFGPDAEVIILGSGGDEIRPGHAGIRTQITRDWAQSDEIAWEWEPLHVSSAGPVAWAWADTHISARMGSIIEDIPVRITAVLEERGDRWAIMHLHTAIVASSQLQGESFPIPGQY
jgi:ketosteroid isomerase-like protein